MSKIEITCCEKPLEFVFQQGADWQSYVPETAECDSCGAYFEKKSENNFAYKRSKGKKYECTNCGSEIQQVIRGHPIHDGPFPLSGSGQCQNESVPYCPKDEEKPSSSGRPIRVPF